MIKKNIGSRAWWQPAAVVLAALVFSYWGIIEKLVSQMMASEDFSGGLLIVPICVYLIYRKKDELQSLPVNPDWRGLSVLILAVCIFIIGELGAELFTTRVSMLVFVIGSVWLLYGFQMLKALRFPLGFLFLMLPLPGFLYRNITFPLQIISSALSVKLMRLMHVRAYREGNVIDIGYTQFQVVEACNGLRFILPLLTVGILFAFYNKKPFWKRLVLIIASVPIAILANVIRIAGTGLLTKHWSVEAAEGFFHSFSGWAVFMLCFGLYALVGLVLNKLPEKRLNLKTDDRKGSTTARRPAKVVLKWAPLVTAAAIILATPIIVGQLGSVPAVPLKQSLSAFPETYEQWQGQQEKMADTIWNQVGGQDYVIIDYTNGHQTPVQIYVAYYEYQRKAGDFIHSPKLCLPGAGWYIQQSKKRTLPVNFYGLNRKERLTFNELLIQKQDSKQLVYYWYQGRGRNFTNEYLAKFYLIWDGIFRRRTDGALVRLIRTVKPNEAMEEVQKVLDDFAKFTSRQLTKHLPD